MGKRWWPRAGGRARRVRPPRRPALRRHGRPPGEPASASSPPGTSRPPATWPTATPGPAAASAPPWWSRGRALLNASAGLSTAYSALVAGPDDRRTDPQGQDRPEHRAPSRGGRPARRVAPVTKWRQRVLEVADIPAAVRGRWPAPHGAAAPGRHRHPARDPRGRGRGRPLDPAPVERPPAPAAGPGRRGAPAGPPDRPSSRRGGPPRRAPTRRSRPSPSTSRPASSRRAEGKGAISGERPLPRRALWPGTPVRPISTGPTSSWRSARVWHGRLPAEPAGHPDRRGSRGDRPQLSKDPRPLSGMPGPRWRAPRPAPRRPARPGRPRAAERSRAGRRGEADDQEPQSSIQRSLRAATPPGAVRSST